jgi:hypothetical protein
VEVFSSVKGNESLRVFLARNPLDNETIKSLEDFLGNSFIF